MGFFNQDMEELLEVFQSESLELMERLEACLVTQDGQEQLSADMLQELFRIVHTMKSSSAMMGLEELSRYTHRLEDLFLQYRSQEKTAGSTETVCDLLYEYLDFVRSEVSRMRDPAYEPESAQPLLERLNQVFAEDTLEMSAKKGDASAKQGEASAKQERSELHACQWRVLFQEDCQMENVRAFLLVKQLKPLCVQLFTNPENLQSPEAAAQIRREGLLLIFTTGEASLIKEKLSSFAYVKAIEELGGSLGTADGDSKGSGGQEEARKLSVEEGRSGESIGDPKSSSVKVITRNGRMEGESQDERVREGSSDERKSSDPESEANRRAEDIRTAAGKMTMVPWQRILLLQNVTGELITWNNRLERELLTEKMGERENLIRKNRQLLAELEELVNAVSMMPVSSMVNQYRRAIRDICKKEGKEISFQTRGEELEADKTMIDSLTTPLLHLIRNAADHGIESKEERIRRGKRETGEICFSVSSMGGYLYFSVQDDGCGLDAERILDQAQKLQLLERPRESYTEEEIHQFIFLPGFSTSRRVTEFSGRGVGLDVVQRAADELRGSVFVESHAGEGTTITVSVPVSLTSVDSLQFSVGGHTCFLPAKNIERIYDYSGNQDRIACIEGMEFFEEDGWIPLIRLWDSCASSRGIASKPAVRCIGGPKEGEDGSASIESCILVVEGTRRRVALATDAVEGQFTIVEKPLPTMLPASYRKRTGINGCAVTADGSIGFILNADWIIRAYERRELYGKTASDPARG